MPNVSKLPISHSFTASHMAGWLVSTWVVLLTVTSLLLAGWAERIGVTSGVGIGGALYTLVLFSLPCGVLATIVLWREPRNRFGWLLIFAATVEVLNDIAENIGELGIHRIPTIAANLDAITEVTWMIGPALIVTLAPLLFPNGELRTRAMRIFALIAIAGITLIPFAGILYCLTHQDSIRAGGHLPDPSGLSLAILLLGAVLTLATSLAAIGMLAHRVRVTTGNEREQLKWFASAIAIVLLICIVQMTNLVTGRISDVLWFGTLVVPIFSGIAIIRFHLFDIDLIISRTLLWGSLSFFVVGSYVAVIGLAGVLIRPDIDKVASLVATGLVAVLFQPMRERLQGAVNRFVYGDRDEPYAAVARLGRRLEETIAPAAILPAIVETVAQALRVPYAALTLREGEHFALASTHGTLIDASSTYTLPLIYNAEQVGQLVLAPRSPGEPLSRADRRLLEDLARQIGVAAHAVQLTADLQRSRERIVTAREEERRRLRNDLHDGLGPVLSGLKLRAETARNLVRDSPDVDALLADIAGRTETAVTDVRRLVYLLRPPSLDDLGLVPALRQSAAHLQLPLAVQAPDPLPPLPAAVEVAIFRIAQEALTNVARHAKASHCVLSIGIDAEWLTLTVRDNGIGLLPDRSSGVGLRSMRERAEELGGKVSVESPSSGGVSLTATLPISQEPISTLASQGRR